MDKSKLVPLIVLFFVLIIAIWVNQNAEKGTSKMSLERQGPEAIPSGQEAENQLTNQNNPIGLLPVPGSIIDLADIPQNLHDPDNRYLRWLFYDAQTGALREDVAHGGIETHKNTNNIRKRTPATTEKSQARNRKI